MDSFYYFSTCGDANRFQTDQSFKVFAVANR